MSRREFSMPIKKFAATLTSHSEASLCLTKNPFQFKQIFGCLFRPVSIPLQSKLTCKRDLLLDSTKNLKV